MINYTLIKGQSVILFLLFRSYLDCKIEKFAVDTKISLQPLLKVELIVFEIHFILFKLSATYCTWIRIQLLDQYTS